ncbi:MAG: bifunctional nuclease family protein [Anaerolineae bacterium]|nr:bifunctional nuclease family protein [Anaerolineae bacterium]
MIEVTIDSVRVSLTNQQRIVVLKQMEEERYLPIWIGAFEAESITIALQEIELARPQTHDLLRNILATLNARLIRIEILSLKDDVFYGNLVVEVNGETINVDARPSDALALAVRSKVPIFVAREIMETAAVIPETDIEEQGATGSEGEEAPSEKEGEERLSIFEDFLQNLDIDDNDSTNDKDEDEPEPDKD